MAMREGTCPRESVASGERLSLHSFCSHQICKLDGLQCLVARHGRLAESEGRKGKVLEAQHTDTEWDTAKTPLTPLGPSEAR